MTTLTDRRVWQINRWVADAVSGQDYDPFGMVRPNRSVSEDGYRFGFNGKEKDTEFGEVVYDYGFRIYDGRICRFLSVDPLTKNYPSWSPYPFAMNRPIDGVDLDGKEFEPKTITTDEGSDECGTVIVVVTTKKVSAIVLNLTGQDEIDFNSLNSDFCPELNSNDIRLNASAIKEQAELVMSQTLIKEGTTNGEAIKKVEITQFTMDITCYEDVPSSKAIVQDPEYKQKGFYLSFRDHGMEDQEAFLYSTDKEKTSKKAGEAIIGGIHKNDLQVALRSRNTAGISNPRKDKAITRTGVHELGHAGGLHHTKPDNPEGVPKNQIEENLMTPSNQGNQGYGLTPTQRDVIINKTE